MFRLCCGVAVSTLFRVRIEIGRIYRKNEILEKFCETPTRAVQGNKGRAGQQLKWRFVPGLLTRAVQGCTVGRARPQILLWGLVLGSCTGRVGLHGPCQPLMFEFLEKLF